MSRYTVKNHILPCIQAYNHEWRKWMCSSHLNYWDRFERGIRRSSQPSQIIDRRQTRSILWLFSILSTSVARSNGIYTFDLSYLQRQSAVDCQWSWITHALCLKHENYWLGLSQLELKCLGLVLVSGPNVSVLGRGVSIVGLGLDTYTVLVPSLLDVINMKWTSFLFVDRLPTIWDV